jgi:hypothetical protein
MFWGWMHKSPSVRPSEGESAMAACLMPWRRVIFDAALATARQAASATIRRAARRASAMLAWGPVADNACDMTFPLPKG